MNDNEFKNILTEYSNSAAEKKDALEATLKEKIQMKNKKISRLPKYLAGAAAAAVLLFVFFAYVPVGQTFAKTINENVIQKIFPPREAKIRVEGQDEDKTLSPDYKKSGESGKSSYVIYVDKEIYKTVTENGVDIIKPDETKYFTGEYEKSHREQRKAEGATDEEIDAELEQIRLEIAESYAKDPPVQMEITQKANITPEDSAREEITKLKEKYSEVSETKSTEKGLRIRSAGGTKYDSPVEVTYFIDNLAGGTFVIRLKYYVEASEGHGSRFEQMLDTFEIVKD